MSSCRRFKATDLFKFNKVNMDHLTETFHMGFYTQYLATWPEYFVASLGADDQVSGYVMGKAEGKGLRWHGHVTAVTVAPEFRRLGLAKTLMEYLEHVSEHTHNGYFVDLYVRCSNQVAIQMYKGMGYSVYRQVADYYGDEDAYDMRKALPRDVEKKSVVPLNPLRVPPGPYD